MIVFKDFFSAQNDVIKGSNNSILMGCIKLVLNKTIQKNCSASIYMQKGLHVNALKLFFDAK